MKSSCILPFMQIIVRPDGKVSLCCQDALGTWTLGDLSSDTISDVWYGSAFQEIRKNIVIDRGRLDLCRDCDWFVTDPP